MFIYKWLKKNWPVKPLWKNKIIKKKKTLNSVHFKNNEWCNCFITDLLLSRSFAWEKIFKEKKFVLKKKTQFKKKNHKYGNK